VESVTTTGTIQGSQKLYLANVLAFLCYVYVSLFINILLYYILSSNTVLSCHLVLFTETQVNVVEEYSENDINGSGLLNIP
jgi:hypothetical protein